MMTSAFKTACACAAIVFLHGCTAPPTQTGGGDYWLNPGEEAVLSDAEDRVLSDGDAVIGGADWASGGGDVNLSSFDRDLSKGDHTLNAQGEKIHGQQDIYLNASGTAPFMQDPNIPKRDPNNEEMMAITVAVSRTTGDPNALSVIDARVDDTDSSVRLICARLHDSGLDDENNRFNVVFGTIELLAGKPFVSLLDSGQRASVACSMMGYIKAL